VGGNDHGAPFYTGAPSARDDASRAVSYTPVVVTAALHPAMARALAALERGRGAEAAQILAHALRSGALTREDELAVRCALAEAWILQDDLAQASAALGRTPDVTREPIPPARLSALWRLHGRIAFARGEQSRAIALQGRALKQADAAHDSLAIGLAHYELGLCYKQVGDAAIVREHITEAASALHAAGDRRHLALVHSLSGIMLAQTGRYDEATSALGQAERGAQAIQADDILATVCGNQANVAMMRHRYDQALALAERAVTLHESLGSGHGLAVSIATLGQICVRVGDLERAERNLKRALEVRSPVQYHETTGAVYDSLAQIHLMRGSYEQAGEYLRNAAEAYGGYGTQTSRWYEWSLKVLGVKLAMRRGEPEDARALADAIIGSGAAPPSDMLQAELLACEALVAGDRVPEAQQRLGQCESRLDPRTMPGAWGEYLRLRGIIHACSSRPTEAYHDIAQSASVFDLLGERYQAALSHLALGRMAGRAGARSVAERYLGQAAAVFRELGAVRDLQETQQAADSISTPGTGEYVGSPADADDAIVRRLVDAAVLPELLARETAQALLEATSSDAAVLYTQGPGGDVRVLSSAGCETDTARALARSAARGAAYGNGLLITESLGRDFEEPRWCLVASPRALGHPAQRRLRMIAAVARQGFELCGAREHPPQASDPATERPLEPLLPGFLCASSAMYRVVEQIQRLQGSDLTVLITGESGTGKDLVARAIHVGSPRSAAMFLPYNCTTTSRDLADSQLFGHRRGAFTGAVTDQQGLVRSAAGGTLFLDEIGDLPLDIQPKLLRFLEQGEIMPVGETRPQRVDVRVLAATNADLEQRVAEGKFREDLYYRLSVIRLLVPPLRDRREEIPHLSAFFLREACERLGKPDVHLATAALDLFANYWWPGNIRQLRNEIQRAVAMSLPGSTIEPDHLSPDLSAAPATASSPGGRSAAATSPARRRTGRPVRLAEAVEEVERDVITEALTRAGGNISETARVLGLTRRGLYMKLKRLGLEGTDLDTR